MEKLLAADWFVKNYTQYDLLVAFLVGVLVGLFITWPLLRKGQTSWRN